MSPLSDLILVPTPLERDRLLPSLSEQLLQLDCALQLCGFGAITAAARAAALIARYRPQRVMLIGIAGSFDLDRAPLGSALRFEQVACDGIGIGSGDEFVSARQLGWLQFNGDDAQPEIGDRVTLNSTFVPGVASAAGLLLTCCAASANPEQARHRHAVFPEAIAEDMEGFGVAVACALAGIPLQIVRGISNRVGERDTRAWQFDSALNSAADLALGLMPRAWLPSTS